MRLIRITAWSLCIGVLAFANESIRPHAGARPNIIQKELEGKGGHNQRETVTPEEWAQVEAWMIANNCRNRLDLINRMGDANGQKDHAKLLMAQQYRQIQHAKDKSLQIALVHEAQAQDKIFGAQLKLRQARHERDDKPQREKAKNEIREGVAHLIDAQADRFQAESEHLRNNKKTLVEEWSHGMIKSAGGTIAGEDSDASEAPAPSPGDTTSPSTP